jgi:hypothetical protein
MTSTDRRAADLAQKILDSIKELDVPSRNARSILTDAGLWTNIAHALVQAFGGEAASDAVDPETEEAPKRRKRKIEE